METLDNAWYGSWRPLTNLTKTFRACHLCTFNVATIFWGGVIPTYGVLPYAMIIHLHYSVLLHLLLLFVYVLLCCYSCCSSSSLLSCLIPLALTLHFSSILFTLLLIFTLISPLYHNYVLQILFGSFISSFYVLIFFLTTFTLSSHM